MKSEKKQFNVRLTEGRRTIAMTLADAAELTRDELIQAALAALIGTKDEVLLAQQRKAKRLAAELSLSFDEPETLLGLAA